MTAASASRTRLPSSMTTDELLRAAVEPGQPVDAVRDILRALGMRQCRSPETFGQYYAAGHRHVPADVLAALAADEDHLIRAQAASNPHVPLPPALYLELAADEHPDVRAAVARNRTAPEAARIIAALT